MTREDIDRIATEYLNDTESTFEMQDIIELADKALMLEKALEDIKADIEKYRAEQDKKEMLHFLRMKMCDDFAEIIDKHISGKE